MNRLEAKVNAKIIQQLSFFLMTNRVKDFHIHVQPTDNGVQFTISSKDITRELRDYMMEKANKKRELEVEIYGFELLGDESAHNELDVLGAFIDRMETYTEKDIHHLIITRTYPYKE